MMTAVATVVFLLTKFTEGAWVVVVAVPLFVVLFVRVHTYYERVARCLGFGVPQGKPELRPSLVIVPVTSVSRLTTHAVSEALSLGKEVMAVSVIDSGDEGDERARSLDQYWAEWNPGVLLRILRTDYASVVDPILSFIDELLTNGDKQIVVLIPVVIPDKVRQRLLHNQIDLVLSKALHDRPDVVVARAQFPLEELAREAEMTDDPVRTARDG